MAPLSAWRSPPANVGVTRHVSNLIPRSLLDLPGIAARNIRLPSLHARSSATTPPPNTPHFLESRQQQSVPIPAYYSDINNSPQPGTVAGIILGSVAGFLFILWLIYLCFNANNTNVVVEEQVIEVPRRARSRRETIEISRSRSPPRRSPARTERIIVEEHRQRTPVEHEDDIVEVIEDNSPARRSSRRESGYRTVDPDRYGGGNAPFNEVRKGSKRSGRR
ncbi:MAG: hypothetical protein M4579_000803 [Chaenotheca gracillima]|nr:MAG: hypothetical protein M4579_000803 [Chaenotheca gracillima]